MSPREMKLNLAVLLSDETEIKDFTENEVQFPSEEEMLTILHAELAVSEPIDETSGESDGRLGINEPVVVIWDTKGGRKWYVGLV